TSTWTDTAARLKPRNTWESDSRPSSSSMSRRNRHPRSFRPRLNSRRYRPSCVSSWNMCRVEICFPYRIVLTDPARGPSPTTTNTDCESSFDVTNSVLGAWTYMGPFSVGQNLEHTALVGRTDAVERADHVERAGTA